MIREDTSKITTKVPLLGDIPFLGALFRSTSDGKKRTNLLIFVTPRLVTDMSVAEQEKARLEKSTSLENATKALDEPYPDADKAAQQVADAEKKKAEKKRPKVGGKP